jgi:hypothetical protein
MYPLETLARAMMRFGSFGAQSALRIPAEATGIFN